MMIERTIQRKLQMQGLRSICIILPMPWLKDMGLAVGDTMEIKRSKTGFVLTPVEREKS